MQQQINLYQPPLKRAPQALTLKHVGLAAAAVALLLILISTGQYWHGRTVHARLAKLNKQQGALSQTVKQLQKTLAQRQPDPALQAQLARLDSQLQHKQRVLTQIKGRDFGNSEGFARVFVGLARQRLDGLWLTGLNISQGGQALDLRGSALDPQLLPRYLQRLGQEPGLQGINFETFLMQRPAQGGNHIDFDLKSTTHKASGKG
jgi:MSHA biogenesis protein MshI